MISRTHSALAILALAALTVIGCGKEDVADLKEDWTKMEADVQQKLTDVKNHHNELMTKMTAQPVANSSDTTVIAERNAVEETLRQHEKQIGEIESTLSTTDASRAEAEKGGKRGDYEAAWNTAKTDYEGAIAKLDELDRQNKDLESKIDGWGKHATVDTTAAMPEGDKADKEKAEGTKKMDTIGSNDGVKKAEKKSDAGK